MEEDYFMTWSLSKARMQFDQLVSKALTRGPQTIRCDEGVVVVIDHAIYQRMAERAPTFKELLLNGPSRGRSEARPLTDARYRTVAAVMQYRRYRRSTDPTK